MVTIKLYCDVCGELEDITDKISPTDKARNDCVVGLLSSKYKKSCIDKNHKLLMVVDSK